MIIKAIFFDGAGNKKNDLSWKQNSQPLLSSSLALPVSVLTLINLLFVLYPQGLLSIITNIALNIN
jgi:hypothetical protein